MVSPRSIPALLLAGSLGLFGSSLPVFAQGAGSRTPRFGLPVQDDNYAVLLGQVKFSDGRPAAGATVRLVSSEGAVIGEQQTDPSGHFSFTSLHRERCTVEAWLSGYRTASRFVSNLEDSTGVVELTLAPVSSSAYARGSAPATVSVRELQVPEAARREYEKGLRSLSRKKTGDAQRHFEAAIKLDPKFSESYQQLGLLLAEQGLYPRADETLRQAIQIGGEDSSAYAYLGYAYQKSGKEREAEQAFRRSIKLSDTNWLAQMGLGQILLGHNQAQEALPHLVRAQQLHPGEPSIYLMVYNGLISLGRGPEALKELDDFLARFPDDPMAPRLRKVRQGLAQAVREARH